MPKHPSLLQSQRYAKTVAFILLFSEVIPLYSCCLKEGLIYVTIAAPSGHQSSSYSECTWLNTRSFYDVRLVSNAECISYIRLCSSYSASGHT